MNHQQRTASAFAGPKDTQPEDVAGGPAAPRGSVNWARGPHPIRMMPPTGIGGMGDRESPDQVLTLHPDSPPALCSLAAKTAAVSPLQKITQPTQTTNKGIIKALLLLLVSV